MSVTDTVLTELNASPSRFAEALVGAPLWDYQQELADCPARYRVVCAGRQVGKSRSLAIIALHWAFSRENNLVLLISAGETASLRLLDDISFLARNSDLLAGSVLDDSKTQLVLSNGSKIISVPASEKQIRGWPVDLLIVDEAGFVPGSIWSAAEPAIIARAGSRVILTSSPWGNYEHFFRRNWKQGMDAPTARVASFHWPSSHSPLISQDDLDDLERRTPSHEFRREYLAEWTDDSGAYFTTTELDNAVAPYELVAPEDAQRQFVAGGIDWGFSNDANAVVLLAALSDVDMNASKVGHGTPVFFIPWLEAHSRMQYSDFIDRLAFIQSQYSVRRYVSETNGVGAMPTQVLQERAYRASQTSRTGFQTLVRGVTTDSRRKAGGFGRIKVLLQQGRLVLPNHPDLLRQLHALEYEQTIQGLLRISVPEAAGHDDLAMALMQAVSNIATFTGTYDRGLFGRGDVLTTPAGTRIHTKPRPHDDEMLLMGNVDKI
ncbi:terminase family protein [Rhodococcus sp. ARC_M12]|uniref:terminase large subunit domain-containing protein n=1 Tax=Rhodococcus sp. ARC_M12 TaxID=2928854 RepID=UPI001FB3D4D9|nr:terminase family protein [Rhodococcus sp. ARC_M12]MCJ0980422.1 terminase family protein [Rhodococcus sp. ARC_M12]